MTERRTGTCLPTAPIRSRVGAFAILAVAVLTAAGTSNGRSYAMKRVAVGNEVFVCATDFKGKRANPLRAERGGPRTVRVAPADRAIVLWSFVPEDYIDGTVVQVRLTSGLSKGRVAWGGGRDFVDYRSGVVPERPVGLGGPTRPGPKPGEVPAAPRVGE